MRDCMVLQSSTNTIAVGGERSKTWTDKSELFAFLNPLSGVELQTAKATNAKATHEIRIRYQDGVTPRDRLKFGQRFFNIKSVVDVSGRNEELVLVCAEDV